MENVHKENALLLGKQFIKNYKKRKFILMNVHILTIQNSLYDY